MAKASTQELIDQTGDLFAKLPPLSSRAREILVQIAPWFALVFGILGVVGTLSAFGLFTFLTPVVRPDLSGVLLISTALGFIGSVLLLAAYSGLRKRNAQGWRLLFWSEAVSLISSVIAFSLFSVLFSLVGLYLVFQIRSYFK